MAAISTQIYFRCPVWWRLAFSKTKNWYAYQISAKYLNPRLRYYYFRFLKANRGYTEIILPEFRFSSWPFSRRHVILQNSKFDDRRGVTTSLLISQDVGHRVQIHFRFLIWPCRTFKKAQCYWHAKFWPYISVHGGDIITSGYSKQMAAILKLYFRLQFWPFHSH